MITEARATRQHRVLTLPAYALRSGAGLDVAATGGYDRQTMAAKRVYVAFDYDDLDVKQSLVA
jgi:hypothetical protein